MAEILPWHQHQWQRLVQARAEGRLAHALLLKGRAGFGKLRFAEALAAALLCRDPRDDGLACGRCRGCRLLAAGTHPDLRRIAPEPSEQVIRVDAIREFIAWTGLTSQEGGPKVALIEPADILHNAAANSLLKTLEEPVPGNHILLVTSRVHLLPATVRSRCQQIAFSGAATDVVVPWLARRHPDLDWESLFEQAGRAPLPALRLADVEARRARSQALQSLLDIAAGKTDALAIAAQWARGDWESGLGWLAAITRDLVRLQLAADTRVLENPDIRPALQSLSGKINLTRLLQLEETVGRSAGQLPGSPLNTQMQLEDLLSRLDAVRT
ncbi:MAG: DNA polymerase III subunit delta' [Pseudomonadota bacterium]